MERFRKNRGMGPRPPHQSAEEDSFPSRGSLEGAPGISNMDPGMPNGVGPIHNMMIGAAPVPGMGPAYGMVPPHQSAGADSFPSRGSLPGEGTEAGVRAESGTDFGQPIRKITEEDIAKAGSILAKCRAGKANLDARVRASEAWWRMRHWSEMDVQGNPWDIRPRSGWLFNAIISKHADGIQAIPEANVLPREKSDQETARMLRDVIPCILEQNHFTSVYSEVLWQKLKQGTGIYGVYWDGSKLGGLGDIDIRKADVLSLYWEPGVTDIQESRNLFYVQLIDNEVLQERYPQLKGKLGTRTDQPVQQQTEDAINTSEKTVVVDWYYKRADGDREVLHYCKYCGKEILYSSENEGLDSWYDHGLYPFVFDPLFPMEGSPCGFGYIDVGKSDQEYIDLLRQTLLKSTLWNANPRFLIRNDGVINEKEAADWTRAFVHVDGNLGTDSIREMPGAGMNGYAVNLLTATIEELKQTTGNTDASTGVNQSASQAASAIAALQEASGKTSRASTLSAYRAYEKLIKMVIELIRQFYDVQRTYRITGDQGQEQFVSFDNAGLRPQPQGEAFGVDMGYRLPEFDLKITTQTATQYTKNMANEWATTLWQLGIFEPANADKAIMMLNMMDFEQKDDVLREISTNAKLQQDLIKYQQMALSLAAKYEPQMAEGLSQQIMGQAGAQQAPMAGPAQEGAQAPDAPQGEEIAQVRNARMAANNSNQPGV